MCGGREGDVQVCGGREGDVQVCGPINISGEGQVWEGIEVGKVGSSVPRLLSLSGP